MLEEAPIAGCVLGRRRALAFAAALGFAAAATPERAVAQAGPVPSAVVTDLAGAAKVRRAGFVHRLAALERITAADALQLEPGARVELVVLSGPGRVFALAGAGRFSLVGSRVVRLEGSGTIETRDLIGDWRALEVRSRNLGRASTSLRGAADDAITLLAPSGAVREQPLEQLRWERPYGRSAPQWNYEVRIVDADGVEVFSTQTQATSVVLPHTIAWVRDADYQWTVMGTIDEVRRAQGSAGFWLPGAANMRRIEECEAQARAARASAAPRDVAAEDVLLALVLDDAGLRQEGAQQWGAVARARPAFALRALAAANESRALTPPRVPGSGP
jgi:hypothetical protein